MREAAVITGGHKLLFERLTEEAAHPLADAVHDWASLRASVMTEVHRLFNTRIPQDAARLAARRRSTVDYGIPDLSLFPPRDPDAEANLIRHLTEALQAFEPRLTAPKVILERVEGAEGGLVAQVAGSIRLGRISHPLDFQVVLRRHGG